MNADDEILMRFVEREINSGKKVIIVPGYLLRNVSDETIREIGRLCRLNGVTLEIRG